jgi:hypothetical protein
MAYRIDRGTLRKPQTLPGGRLRVDAYLTRAGVFEYRNPDGSLRKEYRPPAEVARLDSLATLAGAPVTDDHPSEGEVTDETAERLTRGSVLDTPRMDGDYVAASMVLTSKSAIAKVKAGKQELSCGYSVDIDETPGITPDGQRYDAVQRNIQYNHVALVAVGRAGPQARIRMDAAVMIDPNTPDRGTMDFEKKYLEQVAETAREKARADKAEADLKAEKTRADTAEGKAAAAEAAAKTAEQARNDAAAGMDERVRARVELEQVAKSAGVDVVKGMSDRAVKVALIKKVDRVDVADTATDAYVDGFYASASTRLDAARSNVDKSRPAGGPARTDANDDAPPEIAARAKMIVEQNTHKFGA